MDVDDVAKLMVGIGADRVRARAGKVTCCCVMAPWTHSARRDTNPSMVVYPDGERGPTFGCMACHETGTLIDLLLFLRVKKHDVLDWIQVLDGDRPVANAKTSERLLSRSVATAAYGAHTPTQVQVKAEAERTGLSPDRVFYDYLAVAAADKLEEIPPSVYEPYLRNGPPAYAVERGISAEASAAYELGDDRDMQRLLFPVRDRRGRLVAISGRLYATACVRCGGRWVIRCELCGELEEEHEPGVAGLQCGEGAKFSPQANECLKCGVLQPPKYLHSKGFKRNLVLYGEHMRDEATDGRVYVVEGNIDVVKLWQHHYRPVVAVLGSHPGPAQVEKIVHRWRRVIIVGDGDKAGREMPYRVRHMIADRIPASIKDLDDGKDPGNMSPEELLEKLGKPPVLVA